MNEFYSMWEVVYLEGYEWQAQYTALNEFQAYEHYLQQLIAPTIWNNHWSLGLYDKHI